MRAALLVLVLGCGEDPAPPAPAPPAADSGAWGARVLVDADPCDDPGSWIRTGQPLALTWCTGCHASTLAGDARHGAPDGVDLDTKAGFVAHAERAIARLGDGTMPPGGGPAAADIARVQTWLSCGAPGASAALVGAEPDVLPFDEDIVGVYVSASSELPGALRVRRRAGGLYDQASGSTRGVELVEVDGEDAWLWSRAWYDGDGRLLTETAWDPPLRIASADADAWTVDTTATVAPDGLVREESWAFTRFPPAAVDGWSIDDAPDRVLGLEAGGAEEGWDLSPHYGVVRRWSRDADGGGVVTQQALDQPVGPFTSRYPVVQGDERKERLIRIEGAP